MSLLREIQEAAVDPKTPVAVVLRKCMILAARLGHEPFKTWIDEELNGYPEEAPLPDYRIVTGISSIGNFAGPLGAKITNVPIGLGPVPEDVREEYQIVKFRESVGRLQEMMEGSGSLISRWPGDLVALVATKYYQGYSLLEAHVEVPRNAVVGVLDAVRNKILKFALEIEQQNPDAGDVAPGSRPPVAEERVSQIFNTYVMGPAQNVAVGSPGAVQHAQQLQTGDMAGLKRFLSGQGIASADLEELEIAVRQDGPPSAGQPFGRRVSGWLGTMLSKAGSGAWKVGTSAAGELLIAALKAYYGLG